MDNVLYPCSFRFNEGLSIIEVEKQRSWTPFDIEEYGYYQGVNPSIRSRFITTQMARRYYNIFITRESYETIIVPALRVYFA